MGQFISRLALGVGVPFEWADFDFTLCRNKSYDITWSGSHFPTHWAYLDGVKVGGRDQRDLAGFVFRTPDARASGGTFHNASGSAREVER